MAITDRPVIAVLGVGWVGGALARCFEDAGLDVRRYDPPKRMGSARDLADADICFVCVPTPFNDDGSGFDRSYVDAAVSAIPDGKIVVLKSTILPGTTESVQKLHPRKKVLFNPEFLREATADRDMRDPDRQIIGYTDESRDVAEDVLHALPRAPYMRTMRAAEAETIKYFGNCFLAAKVVFANQIYDVCRRTGIDYETVREASAADPRIGPSHTVVDHGEYRGYGGHCFPKDVRAFIQYGDRIGVDLRLLKTVEGINDQLVKESSKVKEEQKP